MSDANSSSLVTQYLARTAGSRALAQRARRALPGGVTTDTRLFEPYGIYVERADGVYKWDVDGNRYLDFFGGHGALMLGHCHPKVVAAVHHAVSRGVQYAANHPWEVLWAEALLRHFPAAERVRFTGSGTEATLLAIRLARAYSGRPRILRIMSHYHGWHDFAASGYSAQFDGSPAPGVLAEIAANTLLVRPDDLSGLAELLCRFAGEIAAVLIEPLGSHFGHTPTSDGFVREVVREAGRLGILVIFDEVISAFRVGTGGMQEYLGLAPDLTCMAKVAAGGMPGGAVAGSAEVMSVLETHGKSGHRNANKVLHQGTFTGNPVTAQAALATIETIAQENLCVRASTLGETARTSLNELFARRKAGWLAYGRFSGLNFLPTQGWRAAALKSLQLADYWGRDPARLQMLRMALNIEGVDIGSRGTAFISGIHTSDDVHSLVQAFDRALDRLDGRMAG